MLPEDSVSFAQQGQRELLDAQGQQVFSRLF